MSIGVAACGTNSVPEENAGDATPAAAGTTVVEHAYGSTPINGQPERVAAIGWGNAEVALALGIVPVGMAEQSYGDEDGDGVLGWSASAITELGGETPVLFDQTDGVDYEAIAATAPEVILAASSGITQEEYDELSRIAPTIAFPGLPWGTTWRDTILTNAAGLGRKAEGEALVDSFEESLAAVRESHPEFAGTTAAWLYFTPSDLGQVGVYTANDSRAAYLEDLGLEHAPSVLDLSEGSTSFYETISAENADMLADADVIIGYGNDELLTALQADPLLGAIPAIERGSVVLIEDGSPLSAAVSPPSALTLDAFLDEYVGLISDAVPSGE
nr:iron-siderophore ABC transporter substrate-binding protein [Microbacterium amylolyticum]